ncbi:MAG TPA: hypothetical protein VGE02_15145 [Gemmatimonadales bacterium]
MLAVQLEPAVAVPPVRYAWDADTEILSASVAPQGVRESAAGVCGSLEVQGDDGSWLSLELADGALTGAQIAVWPELRRRSGLHPPDAEPARAAVRIERSSNGPISVELTTRVAAEADARAGHLHFRLGRAPIERVARIADRLLLELDAGGGIAGFWLLNVPPIPTDS